MYSLILVTILCQSPIKFEKVPYLGNATELTIYGDVLSHSERIDQSNNRQTKVHETVHYINSKLRNSAGQGYNGFYCLKGRGVILKEPNIKKSQVKEFIPKSVSSNRFNLYIENSPDWNDQPLYIMDEWIAYSISAMSAVEDHQNGVLKKWTDGVFGSLEFSIYAIALAMTVEKYDPEYWRSHDEFKAFVYWWLRGSENVFNSGRSLRFLKWNKQEELLQNLRTSPDCAKMRLFIQNNFNGIWLN